MENIGIELFALVRRFRNDEGQDLIEYALVAALIALGATAGMGSLAAAINTAFVSVGNTFTGYTG
ncbi:MAG: Flp family type IVb pilin [Acidobacteriaceae bacterium]|nr:Flp family type IVb pilin [Acidobacteriaceae bacterium]